MERPSSIVTPPGLATTKLILRCGYSPGDIVMLTAAVRDLHRCYPARFVTDVRTPCPELWENNPHLSPLREDKGGAEIVDCHYPLINHCDRTPSHCLHGFADFLNERLGLQIKLSAFRGDIHLAPQEKAWYSQVHELTGADTPFWILSNGGKYDVTVKWWSPARCQRVVDHFRGKIVFVQVGQQGHHHPKIEGTIDLRGRTTLRELVRLVYHADGVLSPISCLMHLAAAVESKRNPQTLRPCVVIAGGREPVHWEQYPGHQFIHRIGALPCCARGGCWRDRTVPLGDGDPRDQPQRLCLDVTHNLPRCLDLITADEVIHRIESYYEGRSLAFLTPRQWRQARQGIRATRHNPFERLPLTTANARLGCESTIRSIPEYPERFAGRGIVICGGGCRYFTNAWVCIKMLRQWGCALPVELWYLGPQEMDAPMMALLQELGVECIDAWERRKTFPCRRLSGWESKAFAILHSSFQEVLFLDADNVPVRNPEYLFQAREYRETGAIFWPDLTRSAKADALWTLLGLEPPAHVEFESGQILVNKRICWKALNLSLWLNEHSDFFYRYIHGDKETFHLAFRKLGQPFFLVSTPVHILPGTLCQHDLEGQRLFQHRNNDKWSLFARNQRVADFWHEEDCRRHLIELQQRWSGRIGTPWQDSRGGDAWPHFSVQPSRRRVPRIGVGMLALPGGEEVQSQTIQNLHQTDWPAPGVLFGSYDRAGGASQDRPGRAMVDLLNQFLNGSADYLLYLDGLLGFNRYLHHNATQWLPLRAGAVTLAGLYNPAIPEMGCDLRLNTFLMRAEQIYDGQAFLISRKTARYVIKCWTTPTGAPAVRLARLAGRLGKPIYYHCPSLVQQLVAEVDGVRKWQAPDFDPDWKC